MTAAGNCNSVQPTLSLISCVNEYVGAYNENYFFNTTNGVTYYIRFFDGDGSSSSSYNFVYAITQHKEGDFPCNAINIPSLPFTHIGSTSGFTNHSATPIFNPGNTPIGCWGKYVSTIGTGADIYFAYSSPGDEWVRVYFDGTTASLNSELSILVPLPSTSICGSSNLSATQLASGVNVSGVAYDCYSPSGTTFGGGFNAPPGVDSTVTRIIYLDLPRTYYFRVDANNNATTPYSFTVESVTPANGDACSNAIGLSNSVTVSLSNENENYSWGPDDPAPGTICAGTIENTLWMKFTSDAIGSTINVDLNNIVCDNADVVPNPPGWSQYSDAWQFGVFSGPCGGPYTPVLCQSGMGSIFNTYFVPAPNTIYFLVMDGNGGSECSWNITVSGVILLQADVLYLDAVAVEDEVQISWESIHEENTSHYDLQHSTDGINFRTIHTVPSRGALEDPAMYEYVQRDELSTINYYRLQQVDNNGDFFYSPVKQVKMKDSFTETTLEVFPNPARDRVTVRSNTSFVDPVTVRLISPMGSVSWQQTQQMPASGITIPLEGLRPGIYVVEVAGAYEHFRTTLTVQ